MIKIPDEFVIKLISDDFAEGAGGGRKGGVSGTALGLGAKIGLGIGLATEALNLLKETIGNVLRPVKGIIKGIFRLVGELLRPITEVLILILRPILIMARPIIQLFKSFMAPFMSIAREFGRIATQQAAKGNLGLALEASIEGVKTLLAPFIISITSVPLQLASTLLTANIINLVNLMVTGIGLLFQPIANFLGLGEEFSSKMKDIVSFISDQGTLLNQKMNDMIITGTVDLLAELEEGANTNLVLFKDKMAKSENVLATSLTNMGVDMEGVLGSTGSIPAAYSSGLNSMTGSTDSFVDRLKAAADAINAINIRGSRGTSGDSLIVRAGRWIAGVYTETLGLGSIPEGAV